jgi:hypothetical protein
MKLSLVLLVAGGILIGIGTMWWVSDNESFAISALLGVAGIFLAMMSLLILITESIIDEKP